jgi:hypothetical protein
MTAVLSLKHLCFPLAVAAALLVASTGYAPPLPKGKNNPEPEAKETEEAKPAVDLTKAATDAKVARLAAEHRAASTNNLKQIGLALHNYEAVHGKFPADVVDRNGKVLLSWRVLLLPYLEENNLYRQLKLDEPWDSKHNKKLLEKMPKVFSSPRVALKKKGYTAYQGLNGPGAFFDSGKPGRPILTITDGTSNTIAVVEATTAVPWTKPADVPFDPKKDVVQFGKAFGERPLAVLCDGSTRLLDLKKLSKETLKAAVTINGGEVMGNDW